MNSKLFALSAKLRNAAKDSQEQGAKESSAFGWQRCFGEADAYLNCAEWVGEIIETDIAEAELEAIRRNLD